MNDRQRLEAIVSVVCKYLPPDGISKDQAMTEIISLVDPLPEQEHVGEPVAWEGFTNFANPLGTRLIFTTKFEADEWLKDFVEGHAWLKPLSYTTPQPKQEQSVSVSTECVGEPVAVVIEESTFDGYLRKGIAWNFRLDSFDIGTKFYTTPQQRNKD